MQKNILIMRSLCLDDPEFRNIFLLHQTYFDRGATLQRQVITDRFVMSEAGIGL